MFLAQKGGARRRKQKKKMEDREKYSLRHPDVLNVFSSSQPSATEGTKRVLTHHREALMKSLHPMELLHRHSVSRSTTRSVVTAFVLETP